MWDLPIAVEIDGEQHNIRNKCDYRVVLDVFSALNDNELTDEEKLKCALFIFYENLSEIENLESAVKQMFYIISGGEEQTNENKPQLMDWEHDFPVLVAPINKVLGCEVRSVPYLHFYTFLSAYMEIGECVFSTIVSIRSKRAKGKKLDKWEEEYLREHRKMVELPRKLTAEEQEFLDSDW
jgi:hemoglobin-like flavoprotein